MSFRGIPKVHVLRVNPDPFEAEDGTREGALFRELPAKGTAKDEGDMTLRPTKLFAPFVRQIAERLVALIEAQQDDVWWEATRELELEYFRFSATVSGKEASRKRATASVAGAKAKRRRGKEAVGSV